MSNVYDFANPNTAPASVFNPATFAPSTPTPPPWLAGSATPNPGGPPPRAEEALATSDPSLSVGSTNQEIARRAIASNEAAAQRMETLLAQRADLDRRRSDATEARIHSYENELNRPLPQAPQERPIPKAPTREDAQRSDGQQLWLTAAMFLGVLGGSLTRRPITNALAAFTGVVQGEHQASQENWERGMKEWEAANKEALEANEQSSRQYERILKSRQLSIEQKKVALQLEAMRFDDQAMGLAAQMQGEEQIAKLADQRARYAEQLDKATKTAMDEANTRKAESWVNSPEGQQRIKAIGEYHLPMPSTLGRTGYQGALNTAITSAVLDRYPAFDQTQFGARQSAERIAATIDPMTARATERAFAVGPEARSTRSLNVAVDHLHFLDDKLIPALKNGEINEINKLKNYVERELGSSAPTNFDAGRQIIGSEIIKAVVNNGGGVTERLEAQRFIDSARSPEQLHDLVRVYERLMAGQLHGLEQQYQFGGGRKDFRTALRPETQAALQMDFENIGAPTEMQSHIQRLAEGMERILTGVAAPVAGAGADAVSPASTGRTGTPTSAIPGGYNRGRGLPAGWNISPE